jgi:hypothetical protein
MDFIVGLPRTQVGYDSIWVIVDRLTKVAHFIPTKMTYFGAQLAELYMPIAYVCMGYPRRSCPTEDPSSQWIPSSILAQHTICIPTVKQNGPTKYYKIC